MNGNIFMPDLEIKVVEHCNLNCASCTHFSPLAKPSFIEKNDFYNQLQKADVIFHDNCKSLKILGGEPLLHPEIATLLLMARTAMSDTTIILLTNGILLSGMPDDFWQSCSLNNIFIRVTRFPISLDIESISNKASENHIDLRYYPSNTITKSFKYRPLNIDGNGCANDNFQKCSMKYRWVLIKNNRLFPCPIVGNVEHFNAMFNKSLICGEEDSIPLDDVNSFNEYMTFAEKAIQFCRYCQPDKQEKDIGWKLSKQSIQEWI
jgi:hypothetical protein